MPTPRRSLPAIPFLAALGAAISAACAQAPVAPDAAKPPVVAVLPFSTIGQDSTAGLVLSDAIAMEILRTRKARVLERSQIQAILDEQGLQQSGLCDAQECAIQVGRILGVQRIVVGSLGKLGTTNTLNLRLVDIGSSEIVAFASEQTEGPIQSMLQKPVRRAVEQLFGPSPAPPSAAASATPGPKSPSTNLDTIAKPVIPPSAWTTASALHPSALELGIDGTITGVGARDYQGPSVWLKARAWWNLPVATWISAGTGAWYAHGMDRAAPSRRVGTEGAGFSLALRAHAGLAGDVDVFGQYEFQRGYFRLPDDFTGGSEIESRWDEIHTLALGARWKTPVPRIDLLGSYAFGLIYPDPIHRFEASVLWNWAPR